MYRNPILFPILFFAVLLVAAQAQAPGRTRSQMGPADGLAGQEATPTVQAVPVIKAAAQLVVVDVTVTDHDGKPVHGLKASDFKVTEASASQTINTFEEHRPAASPSTPMPALPPNIFTNYSPTPAGGALNVVLLDALNTPQRDQLRVRKQLLAYLDTIPPGVRVAVFGLSSRLILLQGFTTDSALLKHVLDRSLGKASAVLDDPLGGNGTQNSEADQLEDTIVATGGPGDDSELMMKLVSDMREFEANQKAEDLSVRARTTLAAMNQIGRYLAGLQGRKNLIWFSGSFPLEMRPQPGIRDPFSVVTNYESQFRETVNVLARARIAVYPIDARGLMNPPDLNASGTRNYTGANGPARMQEDRDNFYLDTDDEHVMMKMLADFTGGRAAYNTNGLADAAAAAIDEGENFYTLSYVPSDRRQNDDFRAIKVQLDRKGLDIAYRRGYYALDAEKLAAGSMDKHDRSRARMVKTGSDGIAITDSPDAPGDAQIGATRAAMQRGAPAPTEVLFKVVVSTGTAPIPLEDAVAADNTPSPKSHGPYHRYAIDYYINPPDIGFIHDPDGRIHAELKLVTFVYDADGALLNAIGNTIGIYPTAEQMRTVLGGGGIPFHQVVSVPAKGEYFLRIAVHDTNRDRFGAVEVATTQVKPLAEPPMAGAGSNSAAGR